MRGSAATIDRDFGFIGRYFFHEMIECHVLHHAIPSIPFYHAREATKAIRPIMGKHYKTDVEGGSVGFLRSLWRSARWCQWAEPCEVAEGIGKSIWFTRNANGLTPMRGMGREDSVVTEEVFVFLQSENEYQNYTKIL